MRAKLTAAVLLCMAAAAGAQDAAAMRKAVVDAALGFKGVPYKYGAESPSAFDCSGFVRYVYARAAGIVLPRSSRAQWAEGKPVPLAAARPGDVLVFDTVGGAPSHVAILVDSVTMVHAASAGPRTGVILSALADKYFGPRFMGARSFIPDGVAAVPKKKPEPKDPADAGRKNPESPPAVDVVGFQITDEFAAYADKIPAEKGAELQFAVSNATGKDGVFEVLFYRMDLDPSKAKTLRRDRVKIRSGGMVELDPVRMDEPGQYKLILKTHDNMKRVERTWKVES